MHVQKRLFFSNFLPNMKTYHLIRDMLKRKAYRISKVEVSNIIRIQI